MSYSANICPSDAINNAGLTRIRALYEDHCSPQQVTICQEFRQYYKISNYKSQKRFGSLLGLSRGQVQRILRGTAPPTHQLNVALAKLKQLYGPSDQASIRRIKRIRTIEILLPALGLQRSSPTESRRGFSSHQAESLSCRLPIPTHATLSSWNLYEDWLEQQTRQSPPACLEDVNAAGHFFAIREHLSGFEERLFEDAYRLGDSDSVDEIRVDAENLKTSMTGIHLTLNSFHVHDSDIPKVRRELSSLFGALSFCHNENDESVISDFLRPWGLSIDDVRDPNAATGYLIMKSDPLRKCAITVLSQSS